MSDTEISSRCSNVDPSYIAHFHSHLADVQAHLEGNNHAPLRPSYISPTGFWTSAEKELFFHALSVNSRLRPDLISESIGTKTTLDVCAYINVLEEAAAQQQLARSVDIRQILPCSVDASQELIDWEDENSAAWTEAEPLWDAITRKKSTQNDAQKQDEIMSCLDSCHLMIMESMLRDSESGSLELDGQKTSGDSSAEATVSQLISTSQIISSRTESHSTSLPPADHLIAASIPRNVHVNESINLEDIYQCDPFPSDLSPNSRRRLQKRLYMRQKRAASRGENVVPVVSKLRPGRKIKDTKPPKPRPKKYKVNKPEDVSRERNELSDALPTSLSDRDESVPLAEYANHSKSGVTRPYKIRRIYAENGIDADILNARSLGLFHLSTLGRLMKLYRSGYESTAASEKSSISVHTIRLLTAVVIEHTNEAIHKAILIQEQEAKIKGKIKVWRHDHDEVTAEHVKRGQDMMGRSHQDKGAYFAQLLGDNATDPEGAGPKDNDGTDLGNSGGVNISPHLLSVHREILPTQFFHPHFSHTPNAAFSWDLMPEETDQEALMVELQEEDFQDKQDQKLSERALEIISQYYCNYC